MNDTISTLIEFALSAKTILKRILAVFIVFACIGAYFSGDLIAALRGFLPENVRLVAFSPIDVFMAMLLVTIFFALVFTIPFALVMIIRFVTPALYKGEKKMLFRLLPVSIVLFVVGAVFGFYLIGYFGLHYFASLGEGVGVENLWSLNELISNLATVTIGFGVVFQFPVVLTIAVRAGFLNVGQIKKARPFVFVGILVIAAIITPTPDAVTQLLLAIPMYALFEATIIYLKLANKSKAKAPEARHGKESGGHEEDKP